MAKRLHAMGQANYANGFKLTLHPQALEIPLGWKKPQVIFVNSMSDLFHEDVPLDFIQQVFETMRQADHHTFQVLTKRSKRLLELAAHLPWPDNVWMGVSVEYQRWTTRIDDLRQTEAKVKFLSCEPLLGPLRLNLKGIDWVIVGGESGHGARPMRADWARDIRDQCRTAGVPFFFKQWGAYDERGIRVGKGRAGRKLDGATWDDIPARSAV
jgi:protein gp37